MASAKPKQDLVRRSADSGEGSARSLLEQRETPYSRGLRLLSALIVDPSSGSRLGGIHGLRALAAGSILVGHIWTFAPSDGRRLDLGPFNALALQLPLGVTLFFLLSAFLLYRPFAKAVLRPDRSPV